MYEVNKTGFLRDKFVKREALKMLLFGPIFSTIYLTLSYVSMSKWLAFFYVISPLLLILIIFLFIIAPSIMLKRHNKTVKRISFQDEYIIITVFDALWLKSKEYVIKRSNLKMSNSRFYWYGKQMREGIILKDKIEYYLVFDYFTESEEIKRRLISAGQIS